MLKQIEINGFKSFAKKSTIFFGSPIVGVVGPNGSGKSNVAEAFRFVLGEQSMKAMRGSKGEDLIWNGSAAVVRGNRASVALTFDNSQKLFPLEYADVIIERTVYRDGLNEYSINGTKTRLKDIHELLAQVHVGASGHHIISQGQADRILNASPKDRREMLEDALGLASVEFKREESVRKLEKTRQNISQVELLRKESAPRVAFLKKQIERKEKATDLQRELGLKMKSYFSKEHAYISASAQKILSGSEAPRRELEACEVQLKERSFAFERLEREGVPDTSEKDAERAKISSERTQVRYQMQEKERELGRLEGRVELAQRPHREVPKSFIQISESSVTAYESDVHHTVADVQESQNYKDGFHKMRGLTASFIDTCKKSFGAVVPEVPREDVSILLGSKAIIEQELRELNEKEMHIAEKLEQFAQNAGRSEHKHADLERDILRLRAQISELRATVREFDMRAETLSRDRRLFEENLREAGVLIGHHEVKSSQFSEGDSELGANRDAQERERQSIERLKIKLEEIGIVGEEVVSEYKSAEERDAFLVRELDDLTRAQESLEKLVADLEAEMVRTFSEGVGLINVEFSKYFSLLFGGGEATLIETKEKKRLRGEEDTTDEDAQEELGVDVRVHLPRKKISTLSILSGGERALTSIALIFAMSQVNPPPFIILDETDAALDEANSSRYADMTRLLSERSQLIVITHNRSTMSAAGILYGVTMGQDGVSKLLSVKFEEAQRVAK